jgi:hypothetical protein
MDTNVLIWMTRLQQTEALVTKRTQDLQAHQQRRVALEAALEAEQAATVSWCFWLCHSSSTHATWALPGPLLLPQRVSLHIVWA